MLRRANELLTAAVDRDTGFAKGWAALAQARALAFYYLNDIPDPLKAAEEAARKALAFDDSIATPHSALADVLRDRHDWLAAESNINARSSSVRAKRRRTTNMRRCY